MYTLGASQAHFYLRTFEQAVSSPPTLPQLFGSMAPFTLYASAPVISQKLLSQAHPSPQSYLLTFQLIENSSLG